MAKSHGTKQQKKLAKQKAKRSDKRSELLRRDSKDPTVRLARAEKWPVVQALVAKELWEDGIGYLLIARQEAEGRVVFGSYLVDVCCLGVKDAFWKPGTLGDFKEVVETLGQSQKLIPISPACLVKIVHGAVEYALSFGFRPHPDFRHSAKLFDGIDTATCTQEFTFGRDGKPFYFQGPHETPEQVRFIVERVQEAGGHFTIPMNSLDSEEFDDIELDYDEDEDEEQDDLSLPPP